MINALNNRKQTKLKLANGYLNYKKKQIYLGVFITDSGILKTDIDLYIEEKRDSITVKFLNYCSKIVEYVVKLKRGPFKHIC